MTLSIDQKIIIKSCIPFLEQNGVELTSKFYSYMLDNYPEVRPFFNKSHQITKKQPKILAFALLKYAENIDNLEPLSSFVRQIVEKHVGLQVHSEHYDIVGRCLLKTLGDMVGDAATDEFLKAWEVAYYDLANVLIGFEQKRYDEVLKDSNSWLGYKPAKVFKIIEESNDVKSIYIKSNDDKYAKFQPGQYITIRLSTNDGSNIETREYSLSNEYSDLINGIKYYRISIKRINGGVISNYIHDNLKLGDEILISCPFGKLLEPYLNLVDKRERRPIVFFIGGIGITPTLSLIEYFLKNGESVELNLSNSNINSRIFGEYLNKLLINYEKLKINEFISKDLDENKLEFGLKNYKIYNHRMTIKDLNEMNELNNDYYLIGPKDYMNLVLEYLIGQGVSNEDINREEF